MPGDVGGYTTQRIIRAGRDGIFRPVAHIGDTVSEGDVVATVDGEPVYALMPGTVRHAADGLRDEWGMKSGDIDPRCEYDHCFTISDKARAIGGGVLEGLLYFRNRQR